MQLKKNKHTVYFSLGGIKNTTMKVLERFTPFFKGAKNKLLFRTQRGTAGLS
jgi:hypothetical protein